MAKSVSSLAQLLAFEWDVIYFYVTNYNYSYNTSSKLLPQYLVTYFLLMTTERIRRGIDS